MASAPAHGGDQTHGLGNIPAIAWSSLLGLMAVLGLLALVIDHDRQELVAQTESHAEEEALVLADHAARLFDAAELALTTVTDEFQVLPWSAIENSRPMWNRVRRLAERLPYVEGIWLYGPGGQLRLTSLTFPAPELNASEREFFVATSRDGDTGIHVSAPVATPDGRNTFRLSRRLDDRQSRFRGIASLTIDIDFFGRFYGSLILPPGSTIALLSAADLMLLVQFRPKGVPPRLHDVALLRDQIAKASDHGRFQSRSPVDGVERVHAYRRVPGFPLLIKVSIPLTAVSETWRSRILWRLPMAIGAIAGLAALTWLGLRQSRRQREFQALLQRKVAERTVALADANRQLEALVHEVHHRVNNNLQIILSLMALQAAQVRDPGGTQALQQSIGRIHTLALVHQTLYGTGAMVALALDDYLMRLVSHIGDLYDRADIAVSVGGSSPVLPLDHLVPTALIVHEVLDGALRPGTPAGSVHLDVEGGEGGWTLTAHADAPVLPTGDGLSGTIIASLASQMGAEITFGAQRFAMWTPSR